MLKACLLPSADGDSRRHRMMVLYLAVASVPALAAGSLAYELVEHFLRDARVIAVTTITFGLVLWWADAASKKARDLNAMNLRRALLIGVAQVLALVPGVSRSGITITAARFLGFSPDAAARFSFLLAIPITGAAGVFGAVRVGLDRAAIDWAQFGMAVAFAALAGWLCIAAFLALLRRVGLLPFVIYRLALGVVLIWLIF